MLNASQGGEQNYVQLWVVEFIYSRTSRTLREDGTSSWRRLFGQLLQVSSSLFAISNICLCSNTATLGRQLRISIDSI